MCRVKNRSILDVCEDFELKRNAEITLLDSLFKEVEAADAMIASGKDYSLGKKQHQSYH